MVKGRTTVTVTLIGDPGQPAGEVGVIVYTAVPNDVPVAVNVCAIEDPLPLLAPVTPDCTTVHAYVVPATLLVNAIELAEPVQIVCEDGVAVTTGVGLTVIV
jgi:hypothetical protein